MAGQQHQCSEHELGQKLGDGEEQGSLVCYSPCGLKESDTTGQLNNNNLSINLLEEEAFLQRHHSETITVYNAKHLRVHI